MNGIKPIINSNTPATKMMSRFSKFNYCQIIEF